MEYGFVGEGRDWVNDTIAGSVCPNKWGGIGGPVVAVKGPVAG